MKNVAKCNNICEMQNPVNQFMFECVWHLWDMLEDMFDSMSNVFV